MAHLFRRSVLLAALLSLAACSGSKNKMAPAPPDLSLTLGQGGGFTGLWHGFTIEGDGRVAEWRARSAIDSAAVEVGRLSSEAVDSLWAAIEDAALFDRTDNERGNMTGWIRAATGERFVELWWPVIAPADSSALALKSFYDATMSIIDRRTRADEPTR